LKKFETSPGADSLRPKKGAVMRLGGLLHFITVVVLCFCSSDVLARTWYVKSDGTGDALTVRAGIDSAIAGDTVLVACGTYYEHDLIMKSEVCLRGESTSPLCVTIDAQNLGQQISCLYTNPPTRIESLRFVNGSSSGMTITGVVTVRNCEFANNPNTTVVVMYSPPEFYNCIFHDNGFASPQPHATIVSGYLGAHPLIKNCTFVNNSAGIAVTTDGVATVENCIIAFCEHFSLGNDDMSWMSIDCIDLFGNGSARADSEHVRFNATCFIADPQFCGVSGSHNYYLQSDSPCAEGNHPGGGDCDAIGALPVLCGEVKAEEKTWGSIKSLYHRDE